MPPLFQCVKCGKKYKRSSLWTHMEAHREKLHKCDQCGKAFSRRWGLQQHMEMHGDKLHECEQCKKKFTSHRGLHQHKQTAHVEAGQFECDECGTICPHKKALYNHKRSVHSEFECPICGKKVSRGNSSHHMKTHAEQPCECDVCGATFRQPRTLAAHIRHAHSRTEHQCEHCGKTFAWAGKLREHVATHDENREEHRCSQCPQTFKSHRHRDTHMKLMHSDASFTCDSECGLQSATRSEYRDHLKSRHAKEHPASCKCLLVSVILAQKIATNMKNTTFVPADEKMKCTDGACDFATTCARQMESHKEHCHPDAYHPVLRCSSCDMWFATPATLKGHNTEKHHGERRFKCDVCGYITNVKGNFTKHQIRCQQGKARGNLKRKRAESTTENLDVKKETPHDVYKFGSMLGEGGFGKVYKAVKNGEDPVVKYAIKVVGPNGGKSAELEVKLMRRFVHKNVMALVEYYEWEEGGRLTRFIVMECCLPGSLTTMQELVQFEERHVLYVLKEVACGLKHLHSAGIIHRDLKSANVLVSERAEVKISDFGVSTAESIAFNCRGTPGWVAPEVVAAALTGITGLVSAYTQLADMYSVGAMTIDCFLPRKTLPTDFYHKKKVESESFAETQLQRVEDDRHLQLSEAFKRLVTGCLAPMTKRLSATAVLKIPAVKNASVEPFKELLVKCLEAKKEKEEKRSARRREPTTDTEAATASAAATSLFPPTAGGPQQPSTSGGMSSLFSTAPASNRHGQPTATTAATSLFPPTAGGPQQPSTSRGMSSLFSTAPASNRHGEPTANTAATSLFSTHTDRGQQPSTSGEMSSLFDTASS